MNHEIRTIPFVPLRRGIICDTPDAATVLARADDPAYTVMTDFRVTAPITVEPAAGIDPALERMKSAGVRLLFVTDECDRIAGVITSYDIQGEKPIKYSQMAGIARAAICVKIIMTPLEEMPAFNFAFIRRALIRHVVATMRELDRHHTLVIEDRDADRTQVIRGMFSVTHISRVLGKDLFQPLHAAQSLADMHSRLAPRYAVDNQVRW